MEERVYLDNAATTKIDEDILEKIFNYSKTNYGNPSGVYKESRVAKSKIDEAREVISRQINSKENEIYFTSCASESNSHIINKVVNLNKSKKTIITSKIEHKSVLNSLKNLEKQGYIVKYLDVDQEGIIKLDQLKNEISEDTVLVSVMGVNNELGTIEPIDEISKIAKENGAYFHTDFVQGFGKINIDVKKTGIDFLSLSAHKIHGFKGCGALYVNENINLEPYIYGGKQENLKRAGTENVLGIMSFKLAAEKISFDKNSIYFKKIENVKKLRDYFVEEILKNIDDTILIGSKEKRVFNNANIGFKNVDQGMLLQLLDINGISASTGSSCEAGNIETSHVIKALENYPKEYANSNIRFTFSKYTTKEEVDYTLEVLEREVAKLRK